MMRMSRIGILSGALLLVALGSAADGRDVTPPGGVTKLRSTSHDKGKGKWHSPQSKENIVKVSWVAAADNPGGTGVDGYSVAWDEAPETLPDKAKDIEQTETRAESPALADGKKHYFHIRAVDNAGNWAKKAAHLGPFFIDTKRPGDVTKLRVTHGSVAQRILGVSWTAAQDERDGSGVDGYSVLWDNSPKSLPDKTKDIEQTDTKATSLPLAKDKVHYFHIRTVDNAGNWAKKAAHVGPLFFREDKIRPNNVRNLRTTTHPSAIGRWHKPQSKDNTVGLAWTPAKDNPGGSGVDGYAAVWDNAAATVPAPVQVFGQSVNGTTSPALANGTKHYFHIRAVDRAGNWVAGAAHIGPFYIDTKQPGVVTNLRSTSHADAKGKWHNPQSRDNTVDVTWTPARDAAGGSGLGGYSVVWNTLPATLPGKTKNIGAAVTRATSLRRTSSKKHYFHIRAVDNAGNWSPAAVHLGPFYIDTRKPGVITNLRTTSHAPAKGKWHDPQSKDATVDIAWTAAEDKTGGSGIDGYSVVWDRSNRTVPDATKDIDGTTTRATSPNLPDGNKYYFHIRAVDKAGNWSDVARRIGPFYIDTTPPGVPTGLRSTSHPNTIGKWHNPQSKTNTVEVAWTAAKDGPGGSGIGGYSVVWDTAAATLPNATKNIAGDKTKAMSPALADGRKHYVHIRTVDNAGNWSNRAAHLGPFFIDTTKPAMPTALRTPSHANATGKWHDPQSKDRTVEVAWTAAKDGPGGSGVDGYSILWNTSRDTLPDTRKNIEGTVTGATSPPLADGTKHYFHVRTVDRAGNWSAGAKHIGPFHIDATPPGTAKVRSTSHADATGKWHSPQSKDNTVEIAWAAPDDGAGGSGIGGYSISWDTSPTTLPGTNKNVDAAVTIVIGPPLADGRKHYVHIRAVDSVGNWSRRAAHLGPFFIDATRPGMATNLRTPSHAKATGTWHNPQSGDATVNVAWTAATDNAGGSGLGGYSVVWDTAPGTQPGAAHNAVAAATRATSRALPDGNRHYVHVRAVDRAGNRSARTAHLGPFFVDSTPPGPPTNVRSPSHARARNVWHVTQSHDPTIEMRWAAAVDPGAAASGLAGYSLAWSTVAMTLPDTTVELPAGATTTTSPTLTDGKYHFHILAMDRAGNVSTPVHVGAFFIDANVPEIESIVCNPVEVCSLRAGLPRNVDVTVKFKGPAEMNVAVRPVARFHLPTGDVRITRGGAGYGWQADRLTWKGRAVIRRTSPNGNARIQVSGARDLAGNRMTFFENGGGFWIDTQRPRIDSVVAQPNSIVAGTVTITILIREDGKGVDTRTQPTVNVDVPRAGVAHVAARGNWEAGGLRWVGTAAINQATHGTGRARINVGGIRDACGFRQRPDPANGLAWFRIQAAGAGARWPVPASHSMLHMFNHPILTATSGAYFHEGIDIRPGAGAAGSRVIAARAGTVSARVAADAGTGAYVAIRTNTGDSDIYSHCVPSITCPPVGGAVAAGTAIGNILTAGVDVDGDGHDDWTFDANNWHLHFGTWGTHKCPFLRFQQAADRDPGGQDPRLADNNGDGYTVLLTRSARPAEIFRYRAPQREAVFGDVDIEAEVLDRMGAGPEQMAHETGYWVEALATGGEHVRSQRSPYILAYFHNDRWPAAMLGRIMDTTRRGNWANYLWNDYHLFIVTNTRAGAGLQRDVDVRQFWRTRARTRTGYFDNGSDAQLAPLNELARFKDGRYRVHILMKDLRMANRIDRPSPPFRVDNFVPFVKRVKVTQGAGDKSVRYEATWKVSGTSMALTPAISQDARNPHWINGTADAVFEIEYSESMRAVALRISDKNGAVQGVALSATPRSNNMIWTGKLTRAQLARDHRFDSEQGRELRISGVDIAGNVLDSDPSSLARRIGRTWTAGRGGYQRGVDTNHKIRIDTKHDEKPVPKLVRPSD